MFGAKQLSLNRDTESVVALTPNIEREFIVSSIGVRFCEPRTPNYDSGGADRDRTGGLLVANQALSQLSYSPEPQLLVPSR
jgi:hypothetical protein